jgi:hypothetical protein
VRVRFLAHRVGQQPAIVVPTHRQDVVLGQERDAGIDVARPVRDVADAPERVERPITKEAKEAQECVIATVQVTDHADAPRRRRRACPRWDVHVQMPSSRGAGHRGLGLAGTSVAPQVRRSSPTS